MHQLASNQKTTTVMDYSRNKLIHRDLVARQSMRVSILPRMQALANFLHFIPPASSDARPPCPHGPRETA